MSLRFLLLETQWLELIARSFVVYLFLLIGLRLAGRRELGQLTSFDLILLLILSNAVQNSMNAGDNSLTAGLVSATTLLLLNWMVGWATYRYAWFERLVQGTPLLLVKNGKIFQRAMRKERISLEELRSALRKQGIERIIDCARVTLEADGTFTAIPNGVQLNSFEELTDESHK